MTVSEPTDRSVRALGVLARRHGVETSYEDTAGTLRHADPESLVDVLRVLGVPIDHIDDAPGLARRQPVRRSALSPVIVVDPGREFDVSFDSDATGGSWRLLDGEGSEVQRGGIRRDSPINCPPLPVGFWDLEAEAGTDGVVRSRLLVAPGRATRIEHLEGVWGAFAPLHAVVPSDTGAERGGHLGDASELAQMIRPHGGRVVAVLPLLATFLDDPFEPSPYQPVSRRFFSEIWLDPDRLPHGIRVPDLPAAPPTTDGLVDHRALQHRSRALVDSVRDQVRRTSDARDELVRFVAARPEVQRYAEFRAAVSRRGPRPDRLDGDPDEVEHHIVSQWLLDLQLSDLKARLDVEEQALALDLPVGCHPDGYDTFVRPDLYAPVAVGAPPDDFFSAGQNWGFPPILPEASRADGHREFTASVSALARHARVVRIDHVLGLHRLWWIPPGASADQGVYVRYPMNELLAVLRIVAELFGTVVVGENLGTVPPDVTSALDNSGLLGMHEEQFVVGDPPSRRLPRVPRSTVAGVNTHDMPPFSGFWEGVDLADQVDLGIMRAEDLPRARARRRAGIERYRGLVSRELDRPVADDRAAVYAASLERLARSEADQVVLNLEDLWGETRPQNVPGTHHERPNWRRRMTRRLDQTLDGPEARAVVHMLEATRGRAAQAPAEHATEHANESNEPANEGSPT